MTSHAESPMTPSSPPPAEGGKTSRKLVVIVVAAIAVVGAVIAALVIPKSSSENKEAQEAAAAFHAERDAWQEAFAAENLAVFSEFDGDALVAAVHDQWKEPE